MYITSNYDIFFASDFYIHIFCHQRGHLFTISTNLSSGTAPKSFDFFDDNTEYFIHTFTHALKHDHGSGYSQGGIAHGKHFSKHSIWSTVAITNQSKDHQCIIKRTCMEYYGFIINHYSILFGMYQISSQRTQYTYIIRLWKK